MVRRPDTSDIQGPMHRYRSHSCGALREAEAGQEARLAGWCHRIRDHGGVLFVDLRDHYGLTQCVVDPDSPAFAQAERLRSEWVVRFDGTVRVRPEGTRNAEMATGAIELYVRDIEVLGPAAELPLPVATDQPYPEDIRLKYRFLDLRRDKLHANIMLRGAVIDSMRARMKKQGFFEFQTPILTASSPEGARDYLVPSRVHPGKFYALPQAPQQFKQLLMVAGFDRYFQIAPCFRDEDARADRSPGEFYQLDVEMSFVTQDDVFAAVEPVLRGLFEEFGGGLPVTPSFPMISFSAAVRAFGSDKPDLRNPLLIHDVTAAFAGSGFGVFARRLAADPQARVWAIPAPKGGSRTFCDRMDAWAKSEGQPGLAVAKNIGLERCEAIRRGLDGRAGEWATLPTPEGDQEKERFPAAIAAPYRALRPEGLGVGDAVFFVLGRPDTIYKFAGLARQRLGAELQLATSGSFEFCWIVDFPMYERDEDGKVEFSHNPFSMPQMEREAFLALDHADEATILGLKAYQYDIVCNGVELSSGAIRNHRPDVMRKAFALAGYDESVLEERFGGMYRAFQYGAPPHGGIAPGVDRIVMLLAGEENLREIVPFPMNQRAEDLLMGAPSVATPKQLRELHIRLNVPEKKVAEAPTIQVQDQS